VRKTLVLAAAIAALAAQAPPAHGGTYDVWSCRLPDGKPAPVDGWRYEGSGSGGANMWGAGFGLSAGLPTSAVSYGAAAGWTFEAPQSLAIQGYELYRSARIGDGRDGTFRAFALYHDNPDFEPLVHLFEFCAPIAANCYAVGVPFAGELMDPRNRVVRGELNSKRLILRMECGTLGEKRPCGPADPGARLGISRARISLNDAMPPVLNSVSGPLVQHGALLEGIQAVTVSGHDEGGGLQRLSVLVDGQAAHEETLEDVAPSCRPPFVAVVPCARSATRTLAFDTATLANGAHSIQIAADDAAGNRTVSSAVSVTTMNGSLPNGAGASRRAQMDAAFVSARPGRKHRAVVGFGGRRPIKGRLTDAGGAPIGGAVLEVMRQPLRTGAKPRKERTVRTRANVRFRFLPRRGPSRLLRVEYRAFSLDAAPSAVSSVTLNVRAGIRLVVKPRRTTSRGTIHFVGKLLGRPDAKAYR
jgi:hypothetical protein